MSWMLYAALKRRSSTFAAIFHPHAVTRENSLRRLGCGSRVGILRLRRLDRCALQRASLRMTKQSQKHPRMVHGRTPEAFGARSGGAGSFDCGCSLRLARKEQSSLRMTGLESRFVRLRSRLALVVLAKGTMVEGAGTEEPEILRGDRQGLKPDYELDALRGAEAPLFHFRGDLPFGRGTSKSPL